jgi:citrate lyase subunit beta/citryl-CoA lyase
LSPERLHRSYLYAPGDAPDVMRKALAAGADAVILDLEDAVAPEARSQARGNIARLLEDSSGDGEVHVRVNRTDDGFDFQDVRAVVGPALRAIRLPKVDDPDHVRAVDALLGELESDRGLPVGQVRLYPTIESALGLHRLNDIAAASARIVRFAFGATDYLADLAAGEPAADHARNVLVVTSRAVGLGPPIDSVHTRIDDDTGLSTAARRARDLGMFGKSLVHPRQIEPVHAAFQPSADEIAAARSIVEAWTRARADGRSASRIHGNFVDPAVVARAEGLLSLVKETDT